MPTSGRACRRKRRIDTAAPSTATGPMTAHTRDPSGSRASTIGLVRSRRRPKGASTRSSTTGIDDGGSGCAAWSSPARSTHTSPPALTRISSTSRSAISASSPSSPASRATAAATSRDCCASSASGATARTWRRTTVSTSPGMSATRLAQRVDQLEVVHAAFRSSRWIRRGRRAARSPASTARATAGSRAMRRRDRRVDRRLDVAGAKRPAGFFDEHDTGRPHFERHGAPQREVAGAGDEQRTIGGVEEGDRRWSGAGIDDDRAGMCAEGRTERLPALSVGGCTCEPAHTPRTRRAPPGSRGR